MRHTQTQTKTEKSRNWKKMKKKNLYLTVSNKQQQKAIWADKTIISFS